MDRVIIHSDLNNFYASVECLYRPEIRNKPVAVGGNEDARHGIVLAKNQIAKGFGIKTGETLLEARRKCPSLVTVPANYSLYLKFSKMARAIYNDYTDLVEPFGIDECWCDLTGSTNLFGDAEKIANEIRKRIFLEMGITVSIGVSFNKIFAKLGSDMKKPDAITVITRENYKTKVWTLPVSDLLYVGSATTKKLVRYGIKTIGDLANVSPEFLHTIIGVWGLMLHRFANGQDNSPVSKKNEEVYIKSVGNSTTTPRDLTTLEDIRAVFYMLSESVAARLRGHGLKCNGVQIYVRDTDLFSCERQAQLKFPTCISYEIAENAIQIFCNKYKHIKPLRSIGVRGINLVAENSTFQLDIFTDQNQRERAEKLERTIDNIRERFGHYSIQRGIILKDRKLTGISPKDEHTIFPVSYLSGKIT